MELGDPPTEQRIERAPVDVALDAFDTALNGLIETVETRGLDQLAADQKVAVWQRFETLRNRLPLIDHHLIADAEATDLAGSYCSSSVTRFLVQSVQLSPGRLLPGPGRSSRRTTHVHVGERLEPVLPRLAALQRDGAVTVEKVQIVERAMHKRPPRVAPDDVELRSDCSPTTHPCSDPPICAATP